MKRVVICGPESTGKTVLSKTLAAHYEVPWVPELARDYVANLARDYTYEDVVDIARNQISKEQELIKQKTQWVIFDTWLIITKVWFELVYRQVPLWLTRYIQENPVDLFLLCSPDIPWVADGIRENGGAMRKVLFQRYKTEIETLGHPFVIVTGSGQKRTQNAIELINQNHINTKNE